MNPLRFLMRSLLGLLLIHGLQAQAPDDFNPLNYSSVYAVAAQPDGKILIGGTFTLGEYPGDSWRAYLARFNADDTLDESFSPRLSTLQFPVSVNTITVQDDGKILVGGSFNAVDGVVRNNIARLNPDGTLDASFNPNANLLVHALAVQPDGKILVGGAFSSIGGLSRRYLARLNANGTIDNTFSCNPNSGVVGITVLADGRILIGGAFLSVNGVARNRIARLNANGNLDASFNPNADAVVRTLPVQADGKILIAGSFKAIGGVTRNSIARLNPDGSLDSAFNPNANSDVETLAVQADGKILMGGSFTSVGGVTRNRIARLHADGTLDASFNPNANSYVLCLSLLANGKLLVGGEFSAVGGVGRPGIARLSNNIAAISAVAVTDSSQIDWTRGGASPEVDHVTFESRNNSAWISLGKATRVSGGWRMTGLSLPPSGWVRVRGRTSGGRYNGSSWQIEEIHAFGSPATSDIKVSVGDGTHLEAGSATLDYGPLRWHSSSPSKTLTISNAGDAPLSGLAILLSGHDSGDFTASALPATSLAPGASLAIDLTFSPKSIAVGERSAFLTIASNDPAKPLFGIFLKGLVAQSDLSFAPNPNSTVHDLAVQPDGKILIAGEFTTVGGVARNRIARLNADGSLDAAFNPNVNAGIACLTVQADGSILIGGIFQNVNGEGRNRIARLNADGTLDASFNPNADDSVWSFAVQTDGKILMAGLFTSVSGVTHDRIARLNEDGTLDASFGPNANGFVWSLAVQPDGKILMAGQFTTVNGVGCKGIARLNPDGSLDRSFEPSPIGPNGEYDVEVLTLQADGKILMAGWFTDLDEETDSLIVRLNPDGTRDSAFHPASGQLLGEMSHSLALQADGKILMGGVFTAVGGAPRNNFARLNADGTLDNSFDPKCDNEISGVAVQADGKILMAGTFSSVGGVARSHIARLDNNIPATSALAITGTNQIDWTRSGSAPEIEQVTIESWNDGGWTLLGSANRVAGGWRMERLALPVSGRIRARGRTSGGYSNRDSGIIEQTAAYGPCEIAIETPLGANLTTGSTYGLGTFNPGTATSATFKVKNTGFSPLSLDAVTLGGINAAEFTLSTAGMATAVAPGEETTFQVTFAPATTGAKTATLTIASNDPDENPFMLVLTGTGNAAPTFTGYTLATPFQTSVVIPFRKLLVKAIDPDGDLTTVFAADSVSTKDGSIALRTDSLLYTPAPGTSGTDTFEITITDPSGASVTGTVTVNIGPAPTSGGLTANQPLLTHLPDGKISLKFQGIPGRTYQIQRSSDLTTWTTLATITASASGSLTFTDESPPVPNGYYRLAQP